MDISFEVIKKLAGRRISYIPAFVPITGSVNSSILLSQIMYWIEQKGGEENKIWHTDQEFMDETGLAFDELRAAKTKLKRCTFIQISLEGVPARTNYKMDIGSLMTCLNEVCKSSNSQIVESPQTSFENPQPNISLYREIPQTSLCDSHKQACGDSTDLHLERTTDRIVQTEQLLSPPPTPMVTNAESKPKPEPTHPRWIQYATRLNEACMKRKGLIDRTKSIPTWARELEYFVKKNTITLEIFREYFDWYVLQVPDKQNAYLPQAFSGYAFASKWDQIVSAKDRWDADHPQAKKERTVEDLEREGLIVSTPMTPEEWEQLKKI